MRVYVCVYVCVCVVYALKYLNDKQVSWRGTRRSGVVTDRCDCANSQSTKYRIGSLPETVGRIAWSQGFYPSNGILRKENMTRNNIFKKLPWACFQCNFLRSLEYAFDRLDATAERIPVKFWGFFGSFLTQMGPKVDFVNFWWNYHKGQGPLWWFRKRFAVIQKIFTLGIYIHKYFPSWDWISGSHVCVNSFGVL